MKSNAVWLLVVLLVFGLASCSPAPVNRYSRIRCLNHYYNSNPMGSSAILGLTLKVTFPGGDFNMINLPVPPYNSYSDYSSIATAREINSFLGPGDIRNATSIQITIDELFGRPTYTLYSPGDGIGPLGSHLEGYWSSENRFLITFDGSTATLTKEQ